MKGYVYLTLCCGSLQIKYSPQGGLPHGLFVSFPRKTESCKYGSAFLDLDAGLETFSISEQTVHGMNLGMRRGGAELYSSAKCESFGQNNFCHFKCDVSGPTTQINPGPMLCLRRDTDKC
jgi:hypothetical protein